MKREIKFQIEMQHMNGEKQVMVNSLFDIQNGMCYHELGVGWKINWYREYTGLKDKQGVDIFEGDIVEAIFNIHGKESSIKFNAKVIYNSNIGSFQISYPNNDDHFVSDTIYGRYFLKVIGNIYQTPELL